MDDLNQVLEMIWTELAEGVRTRHHGFHLPTLSTSTLEGVVDARVVVLRRVEVEQRVVHCHTDQRAPKVAAIRAHPDVHWLFYDFERRTQLRIRATAEVLTEGPVVEAAWADSSVDSRRCYLAPRAPGAESAEASGNLPAAYRSRPPGLEESEFGRVNFAVIRSHATGIDWLHLASDGHRRARFGFRESEGWSGAWIEP